MIFQRGFPLQDTRFVGQNRTENPALHLFALPVLSRPGKVRPFQSDNLQIKPVSFQRVVSRFLAFPAEFARLQNCQAVGIGLFWKCSVKRRSFLRKDTKL